MSRVKNEYLKPDRLFVFFVPLLAGLAIMPINLTGWSLTFYPGKLADARFNLYILEHGYRFLSGEVSQYWNAPFMFPEPNVISYSDNLLGTVPLYGLFRLLGFELFTAFQLWFISLFALNYTCFYFFAKYVFKNSNAAIIGAFVFAFSMANQSAMAHVQVIPRFFIPLAFWMILRFGENFKPRFFFLALLFMTAELYASIYLGLLTFLTGGVFLVLVAFSSLKKHLYKLARIKWWLAIVSGIVVNLTFIAWLMYPYLVRSDMVLKSSYSDILITLPTPLSFIHSNTGSLIWGFLSKVGNSLPLHYNQQLFPGGIALLSFLILLGFFIFRFRKLSRSIRLIYATGLIVFLVFIRFGSFTLYKWVYALPGYDSMRSMDRIINIELLFFGIAAAWLFSLIFRKIPKWQLPVFLFTIGLLCFDNYVDPDKTIRTEKAIGWGRVEHVINKMQDIPANAVISYEPDSVDRGMYIQLDGMLAAQYLGMKSVNGYSATCPGAFGAYWRQPNARNRNSWLEAMNMDSTEVYIIK